MSIHNHYQTGLSFNVVIWRFVFVPTIGFGAGVFYTNSEGQYWHFNNIGNPNVSLEDVSKQTTNNSYSYGSYIMAAVGVALT